VASIRRFRARVPVARFACLAAVGLGAAGGCGGAAGDGPRSLAAFQRRALTAISNVTQSGIGFRGHAMLHLRYGMRAKERAAAAGAATLASARAPTSVRQVNARLVGALRTLHRDFVRAASLSLPAALATDDRDVARLVMMRSAVQASSAY
jgi:hypothetical protein